MILESFTKCDICVQPDSAADVDRRVAELTNQRRRCGDLLYTWNILLNVVFYYIEIVLLMNVI